MNNIYKIETYSEAGVNKLANYIKHSGGHCIVRGWAVITDYEFNEIEASRVLHLVARISDSLTDDDMYSWSAYNKKAA